MVLPRHIQLRDCLISRSPGRSFEIQSSKRSYQLFDNFANSINDNIWYMLQQKGIFGLLSAHID